MDLSGRWRAQAADEGLRRAFPDPRLDDSAWPELEVPGHWRSSPAFDRHDGPLLYRRRFELGGPERDRRWWLVLDGLFYLGDVWLDGAYVGATEGYFFPHAFEVTTAIDARRQHLLAVEVACARPDNLAAKRAITGVFQHWDCLDPDWNPGGIWRPVRIEDTGPVRIARLRLSCREATDVRAVLRFRATLDAAVAGPVTVRTAVDETDHVASHTLAVGENRVEWSVVIDRPRLWWPHALGPPALCDLEVEVLTDPGPPATVSDRRRLRAGLRQVRMEGWILHVNGERLFLKGANLGPTRMALAEASPAELAGDVQLAKEAGLDLLRVHAHVTRPELYDAADESGMLLWQDLPLQWGYARGIRRQATRQAREAVDLLGHHPSIAIWCGHNEPVALDIEPGRAEASPNRVLARLIAGWELPTWNKTVLDASVRRALERADGTRPVIPHSGIPPHPFKGGTDSHLYFGWYQGRAEDLAGFLAAFPRMARFVSEFGAQAVPANADFCDAERWPDLDWTRLERSHALQKHIFDRFVPAADHATFDGWRSATQRYQAELITHYVETLRRLKYRPTGGFCQFCLADGHPAVTWSLLDHQRAPKLAWRALAAACRPVIVVADRPAATYRPGEPIALDVHVVNDLRTSIVGHIDAVLRWPGGQHAWSWAGESDADACGRVGTVRAVTPDADGELVLELSGWYATASGRRESLANRYTSRVSSMPHGAGPQP